VPVLGGDLALEAACAGGTAICAFALGLASTDGEGSRKPLHDGDRLLLVMGDGGMDPAAARPRSHPRAMGGALARRRLLEASETLRARGLAREIELLGAGGVARAAVELGSRVETGVELDPEALVRKAGGGSAIDAALAEPEEDRLLLVVPA